MRNAILAGMVLVLAGAMAQKPDPNIQAAQKSYAIASSAQRAGNFATAKKLYVQILHKYPAFYPAHLNLAGIYLAERLMDKMSYHLSQAYKAAPKDDEVNTRIALTYAQANRMLEAQTYLGRVSAKGRARSDFLYTSGLVKISKHDRKGALSDLEKALAKDPGDPKIMVLLGAARIDNNDSQGAIQILEPATKKFGKEPSLWQSLAEAYTRTGQMDKAVSALEKAHALVPEDIMITINLARGYESQGKVPKAVDLVAKLVRTFPLNIALRLEMGDLYMRQKQWKPALDQYMAALGVKPRDPDIQNRIATVNVKLGNYAPAAEQFDAVIRVDPKNDAAYAGLEEIYRTQHQLNPLIRTLQQWVANVPGNPYPSRMLCQLFQENRDDVRAEREYVRHLKAFPDDNAGRRDYARLLEALNKRELAIEQYRECVKRDKNDIGARVDIALALFALGRMDDATAELNATKVAFPQDIRAGLELATYYQKVKDFGLAANELRDILKRSPNNQIAILYLAECQEGMNDIDGALANYEKLLALSKNPSVDFQKLPEFLWRHGRKEEAERRWRERVAANPRDAVLRDGYGSFLIRLNKMEDALAQFKEWKNQDPKNASPRLQIAQIYQQQKKTVEWEREIRELLDFLPDEAGVYSMLQHFYMEEKKPDAYWDTVIVLARRGSDGDQAVQSLIDFSAVVGKLNEAVEVAQMRTQAEPRSKGAWLALARGLEKQEKWVEAIDAYGRASRLDPSNPTAVRGFAALAEERGTKKQAVEAWKLYTDNFPADMAAQLRYGNLLRANGQNLEALDVFRKVLDKYPDNQIAKQNVNELEKLRGG